MSKKTEEVEGISEKMKQLRADFAKAFGKNALTNGVELDNTYDVIKTGSIGFDKALGIGGLPRGRLIELIGWESSGKTTCLLEIIANCHKEDKNALCGFVDSEHALDLDYAEKLGVDLNRLEISKPMNGEEAFDMLYKMTASGLFHIVGFDSIASSTPGKIIEEDMANQTMGLHARLVNKGIERLPAIAEKTNTMILMTNQYREKIGVMFGSPDVPKGGNAPKFYCTIRCDISRSFTVANSIIEEGDTNKLGNLTKIKVIKNKVAPPFRGCEFYIRYNEGIDKIQECIDLGLDSKIIVKEGNTYKYNEQTICVGKNNLRNSLLDNEDLYNKIYADVYNNFNPKTFEPEYEL